MSYYSSVLFGNLGLYFSGLLNFFSILIDFNYLDYMCFYNGCNCRVNVTRIDWHLIGSVFLHLVLIYISLLFGATWIDTGGNCWISVPRTDMQLDEKIRIIDP